MLRTLSIENFRAFERFSMEGLGRINLLVGTNNCGKTSVLEAISIAAAPAGTTDAILAVLNQRDELVRGGMGLDADIQHLFRGHALNLGVPLSIRVSNDEAFRGHGRAEAA